MGILLEYAYGGLPTGGNFNSRNEYTIGLQRTCEAAHCIIGSLHRGLGRAKRSGLKDAMVYEIGHVKEEFGIIEHCKKEYSRSIYLLKEYFKKEEIWNDIFSNCLELKNLVNSLINKFISEEDSSDPDMIPINDLAFTCYNLIFVLAQEQLDEKINVFNSEEYSKAFNQLKVAYSNFMDNFNKIEPEQDEENLDEEEMDSLATRINVFFKIAQHFPDYKESDMFTFRNELENSYTTNGSVPYKSINDLKSAVSHIAKKHGFILVDSKESQDIKFDNGIKIYLAKPSLPDHPPVIVRNFYIKIYIKSYKPRNILASAHLVREDLPEYKKCKKCKEKTYALINGECISCANKSQE